MPRIWFGICLAAALLLSHSASIGAEPYCTEEDRFYPDGRVVKMGERYFRFCHGTHSDPGTPPVHKFIFVARYDLKGDPPDSPASIEVAFSLRERDFDAVRERILVFYTKPAPPRNMGGVRYLTRNSVHTVEGAEPPSVLYLYEPMINADAPVLPPHFLNCIDSCFLTIKYGDLLIDDRFFDLSDIGGNAMRYDDVPGYAAWLPRIFDQMDVTDEIEDLRGKVEIIE